MTRYVPAALRKLVSVRARGLCEYCLIHENDTFFGCEVEHVISEKHGGGSTPDNLAFACVFCNRHKGSDIASLSPTTSALTRLFNPRTDRWSDHFSLDAHGAAIHPKTEIGEVTARLLQLNHPDRIIEREALRWIGRFPSPEAIDWIG